VRPNPNPSPPPQPPSQPQPQPLTLFPGFISLIATSKAVRAALTASAARPVMGAAAPPALTWRVVAWVAIQPSMWQPRSLLVLGVQGGSAGGLEGSGVY